MDKLNDSYTIGTTTDAGSLTISSDSGSWKESTTPASIRNLYQKCDTEQNNKEGGDEDMRYLYEVILVNLKNDTFSIDHVIARSETSALMEVYEKWEGLNKDILPFDDLKTSCRVLMEWKKEKSLKKAIETIKKAVE